MTPPSEGGLDGGPRNRRVGPGGCTPRSRRAANSWPGCCVSPAAEPREHASEQLAFRPSQESSAWSEVVVDDRQAQFPGLAQACLTLGRDAVLALGRFG